MSFDIALSGLQATSQDLNTISNNIANASTVGFRGGRSEFSAIYNGGMGGGVNVMSTTQNFSKGGSMTYTGRQLDMGIQGKGFFVLAANDGSTMYSRAGMFHQDALGYVVDPSGNHLRGYSVNSAGQLQSGNMGDLQIKTGSLPAKPTTQVEMISNMDARVDKIDTTAIPFKADNPASYHSSGTVTVFDSLGKEHALTQYYVKTADNTWDVHFVMNGQEITGAKQTLTFDKTGKQTAPVGDIKVDINDAKFGVGGATGTNALDITLNFKDFTQYAAAYNNSSLSQNGYTSGTLNGIRLDGSGKIFGTYTNGQQQLQGQVAMADFSNPNGLTPVSDNAWVATLAAGQPVLGAPSTGTLGSISGGYLESSNVDNTAELVSLMTAQRNYQSNAKVLDTDNTMQQALLNAI